MTFDLNLGYLAGLQCPCWRARAPCGAALCNPRNAYGMKLLFRIAGVTAGIVIAIVMVTYWNPRQTDMVCDVGQDWICQQRFVQLDRPSQAVPRP
jgi:hypothetical protein